MVCLCLLMSVIVDGVCVIVCVIVCVDGVCVIVVKAYVGLW